MKTASYFRLLAILFALGWTAAAYGAAPKATTGNPGYYRFPLGDFEVTTLSDGSFDLPVSKMLTGISAGDIKKALDYNFLSEPLETSDDAFLINTGDKLVLVDAGTGGYFGPTVGKLVDHMKAAGYQPEQVDVVLITHLHPDHVGGLSLDGKMVFPNAAVYAGKADIDYFMSQANLDQAADDKKMSFKVAQASLAPYVKAGQLKPLTDDVEIVPGIRSHASPGHSPGHETYIVESKGQKLALLGDIVHVAAVQFADPSVRLQFDSDPKQAEGQRKAAFSEAAKQGYLIGAAHLPFPGIGHVRADKKGFAFVPANYTR